MKFNAEELFKRLSKAYSIKVPGAALLLLAETLRNHQAVLMTSIDMGKEAGLDGDKIASLEMDMRVNETLGCLALDMISEAFGEEFLDDFIEGKINIKSATVTSLDEVIPKGAKIH